MFSSVHPIQNSNKTVINRVTAYFLMIIFGAITALKSTQKRSFKSCHNCIFYQIIVAVFEQQIVSGKLIAGKF